MRQILTLTAIIIALFSSQGSFAVIYPTHTACAGTGVSLYDSSTSGVTAVGTWTSSNTAVATIGASTGFLTAVSAGTTVISFVGTSVTSSVVFTVNPVPGAITGGGTTICVGTGGITLSCTPSGGTWSSSSPGIAGVGVSTGSVWGATAGTATITYKLSTGCRATTVVTVTLSDSLSGAPSVCVGGTTTIVSTFGGGTWTSSAPAVATVSSTGVVTALTAGTAFIEHATTGTSCGPTFITHLITVTSTTSPGTITGTTTVAIGSTTTLSNTVTGGTWASGSTGIATISGSGVVTGVAAGTAVITYTVTGCSGPAFTTTTVTVTTPNCISGDVLFTGTPYYGPVKVWLIKYNPTTLMLTACDSTYVYSGGASVAYSFCGMGTDSFRIKAACDSISSTTGYIPTYHTSSAFWHSASVVYHISGTHDINKDITMIAGTPTSGPGFIAGDVTTGANKGTTDFVPAPGILVYCINNTTGAILQHTVTDAAGHYSFSSLPVGATYKIYPEAINYATTPYSAISLTSAIPSKTAADFQQHTVSMTITPKATVIVNTPAINSGVNVFPNPASGKLNVQWNVANAGTGTIVVADVTGRVVLSSTADMSQVTGNVSLNLNGISNGIYIVSIRANGVNYNNKIEIQ